MTQAEYMAVFTGRLGSLPIQRKQEIIEDILDHFREGAQEGVPEETLAERLGEPEMLAKEYCAQFATESASKKPSVSNIWRVIFAGIGMGMLNLVITLPIAASAFAVWISLLVTGGALILSGALVFVVTIVDLIIPLPFAAIAYPVAGIFGGLSITALGGLLLISMLYSGRWLGRVTSKYVGTNVDIIIGRRKQNEPKH